MPNSKSAKNNIITPILPIPPPPTPSHNPNPHPPSDSKPSASSHRPGVLRVISNRTALTQPIPPGYTKIDSNSKPSYMIADGKEIHKNTKLYHIVVGTIDEFVPRGTSDDSNLFNNLYVLTRDLDNKRRGGYRKRKTFRTKSKRFRCKKQKTRRNNK